ncbi:hypothetical protein HBH56_051690 [Parastagonospora nodorum]|uniref:Cell wall anchored protein n=2 Tax=Phaeosphaeria nodorum (strain SN15 / ATCC MYA-4574 / FGSC 10173) TaxID=321614 RepID=A0A7U2FFK7_PHANO|nr:hypothetical protein HBH56_051690 [Parastagonospora nodorum]QRD02125.1 hypothetical protein JI435_051040 [Parastagonospora nodorum SN15]KAH3935799.1 hypothetical protein HBH54_037480 [Parastagonospora nodorum]KAH3942734.1 hypothetical protein HBH53_182920 [Parastagonospora nodorum]KAH3964090.1 hypothetical protein HBH51_162940 [Parastagonospora nodorum]
MAYMSLRLLLAFRFVAPSFQDDPILDFCRRWNHQTAIVDGRLYIDGGAVAYKSLATNYTNDYLLFSDLSSRTDVGFPQQHSNLSKPANVPSLSGGILWADEVNKCFYQFGGAFQEGGSPKDFGMWTYDVILDQWNTTTYVSSDKNLQRPAFGAGTQVDGRGLGFYYGGWLSSRTTPGWSGPPIAVSSIVQFNFTTGNLRNNTHPDGIGRAEGQMVYLPVSDNGLLIYFGGIEDPYHNGSHNAASMSKIHIYDINSGKWYSQTATGDVPAARRQFCAGVTWPDDRSSFNIYLYGGYGFSNPAAFDDAYILSLPSFTWVKAYGNSDAFGHGGCSANVVNPNQMLIIGGWYPNSSFVDCDQPDAQGQHNMVMGNNTGKKENGIWDKYDPKLTDYAVPTLVVAVIGGGPTGGATVTAPATWDSNDVRVYYNIKATPATRAATRLLPATSSPTGGKSIKRTKIGAIAGGTIGGLVILIALLSLVLFCLYRRKKAKKTGVHQAPSAPPAELAVSQHPYEMSTTGGSKYKSTHAHSFPNELPAYSGQAPVHPRPMICEPTRSHESSASQGHVFMASQSAASHESSPQARYSHHSPNHSLNGAEPYFASEHTTFNVQQNNSQQRASTMERRYSYPTPISPYPGGTRQESSTAVNTTNAPAQFYTSPVSPDAAATGGELGQNGRN